MGISRFAGRFFGRLANPSWTPQKPKPLWHESSNRITNLHVVHKNNSRLDMVVNSKSDNEHDIYVVVQNPDTFKTKYIYAESIGNFARIDTGDPQAKIQSTNPINSKSLGIYYSGFDAVVEHLKVQEYEVYGLRKGGSDKNPIFQGEMVHPQSRHNTTYNENKYGDYVQLTSKSDESKQNERLELESRTSKLS
jgi:hypothetical protein